MPRVAIAAATDPIEALIELEARLRERREHRRPACPYEAERGWERRLHELLGVPWPCPAVAEFWALWPEVTAPVSAKGLRIGRATFGCYNDGDPGLLRAVWCLTRHLLPTTAVETGVARGFTSRFILEALERNGAGHLWSIDRPPPLRRELREQVGVAVGYRFRDRWSYVRGSSRRRFPGLLSRLGRIDLFVHDSRHSEDNVRFELDRAWAALRPGGVLVVDDIDLNRGFSSFTQTFSGHHSLICYAEPLRPDPPRFDGKGLFGIIRKDVLAADRLVVGD
ncbi:MAG TPA: class I SAM-dependent methyltransferase [bacterium]|nr:class I SAM-dependent methyltransferase [bacterium]